MKTDICIRGAGIVGQVLALLLARERIGVHLVQGVPPKQADLRSFALNAASRQMLMDLRVWPDKLGQASPVQRIHVFGDTVGEVNFDAGDEPLAWIVDASVLQERLALAIGYAPEIKWVASGQPAPAAELTVICEGRVSQTRHATGAAFEQHAYAQSAIAAHIICELPHQSTAWQWMQTGQICAFLPRGESCPGNSVALVWSVTTERAAELLALPDEAFFEELNEATHGHLGRLALANARPDAVEGFREKSRAIASWPLVLAQAHQWCGHAGGGAWVLAGDAAHAVHPLAGQGLNLGLADVAALATAIASKPYFSSVSDMRMLRSYERARKGHAALLRLSTDGLQQIFQSADGRALSLRNWAMQGFQAAMPLKAWLMRRASGRS